MIKTAVKYVTCVCSLQQCAPQNVAVYATHIEIIICCNLSVIEVPGNLIRTGVGDDIDNQHNWSSILLDQMVAQTWISITTI